MVFVQQKIAISFIVLNFSLLIFSLGAVIESMGVLNSLIRLRRYSLSQES
jgi:hypothetical protein